MMASTSECSILYKLSNPESLRKLREAHHKLGVARCTATNGKYPFANVVWRSAAPEPNWAANWTEGKYALNWTREFGENGTRVELAGDWQPAQISSRYDIDENGKIQTSGPAYDRKCITVRNLGPTPVHIIIGAPNPINGAYDPIWMDPNSITQGNNSKYLPDQRLLFWYSQDAEQGSVFDPSSISGYGQLNPDMFRSPWDKTKGFNWAAEYDFDSESWTKEAV